MSASTAYMDSLLDLMQVYEVFARLKYDEPLHQVGSVTAPNEELARSYAFNTYNEWAWIEMIIVPRYAVIPVIKTA